MDLGVTRCHVRLVLRSFMVSLADEDDDDDDDDYDEEANATGNSPTNDRSGVLR